MPRTLVTSQTFRPANILINGLFDYWQYSTSAGAGTTPSYNSCDRWMNELSGAGTINFAQSSLVPNSTMRYSCQITKTSASSGARLNQRIEADNIASYIGKTVCFSFWIRLQSGTLASSSLTIRNALSKDTWTADNTTEPVIQQFTDFNSEILTGSWVRIYRSFVVTADCVNGMAAQLQFNVGTDYILQIAGCMLTEGPTPPTDTYRQGSGLAEELTTCQRYFEKSWDIDTAVGTNTSQGMIVGRADTTTAANCFLNFNTPKRVVPTSMLLYGRSGTQGTVGSLAGSGDVGGVSNWAFSGGTFGTQGAYAFAAGTGTLTAGTFYRIHWSASAEL